MASSLVLQGTRIEDLNLAHRARHLALKMYAFPICLAVILTILHLRGCHTGASFNHSSKISHLSTARLGDPYPRCTSVPHWFPALNRFDTDCLGAWEQILLLGDDFIEKNWRWSRWPKDQPVPPRSQSLPFEKEYRNCAITIDILGTENTVDNLALFHLGVPMRRLFFDCISIEKGELAAGWIPVGEGLKLKLSIGPAYSSRSDALQPASNGTMKPPIEHQ